MKSSTDRARCLLAIQGMAGGLEPGLDALVHALQDEPLKASSLEPSVAGGDTELWCFTCETAANQCRPLQDSGGTMYGHDWQVIPRRSDPTGNAATNESREASALREFDKAIAAAHLALRNAVSIAERHLPHPPTDSDDTERDTVEPGWCRSCFRDNGYHEPVWNGYSKTLCQWCYSFENSYDTLPVVALVRIHRNGRVYDRDISRHMPGLKAKVEAVKVTKAKKKAADGIQWRKADELETQAANIEAAGS